MSDAFKKKRKLLIIAIFVCFALFVAEIPVSLVVYYNEYNAQMAANGFYDNNIQMLNQLYLSIPFGTLGIIGLCGTLCHCAFLIVEYYSQRKKKGGTKDAN